MKVRGRCASRGMGVAAVAAVVVTVVALVIGGPAGFVVMAYYMEQRDDIPASWAMELGELDPELFPDPVDTTAQTCTKDLPCRWAVASDTAVVMMFDKQIDACRAEGTLPHAVRQDWVAVDFTPGALSQQQRDDVLMHLDSYNRYPGNDDLAGLDRYLPGTVETCPE